MLARIRARGIPRKLPLDYKHQRHKTGQVPELNEDKLC